MRESPDPEEVFEANPEHMKLLDSLECRVQCDYRWDEYRRRLQLVVIIDDKTTRKDVTESWQYIKVMREMLHNFQGPYWEEGQFIWKGLANELHTPHGGGQKPKQIATRFNNLIDKTVRITEAYGIEYQIPEGYPFDNVYVENMIKNWGKYQDRYREKKRVGNDLVRTRSKTC